MILLLKEPYSLSHALACNIGFEMNTAASVRAYLKYIVSWKATMFHQAKTSCAPELYDVRLVIPVGIRDFVGKKTMFIVTTRKNHFWI
jgi:hypothetical protein